MRRVLQSLLLSFAIVGGCTAVLDGALRDPVSTCAGEADGTPCRSAELCLSETCIYSSCGDGFVDEERGEECDDGNLLSGDGCEPGRCRFSCARTEQCEDENPCTSSGGCELETHTCRQAVAASGAACERDEGGEGICRSGLCASTSCGNGVVDADEECDSSEPGCRGDCRWVCDAEQGCSSPDQCAMPVSCDLASHVCVALAEPDCNDDDACSADTCDALEGCRANAIDADADGYSPGECAPGSEFAGGDCDDASVDRHPNAQEMLNALDDDCDTVIDENPGVTCLRDADLDGFGDPDDTDFMPACTSGWVASRPRNDCNDANAAVNPSVTTPSPVPYCETGALTGSNTTGFGCSDGSAPSWDWDCDGSETGEVAAVLNACSNLSTCGGTYWATAIPACGATGTLRNCMQSCLLVVCSCNNSDTPNVTQRYR